MKKLFFFVFCSYWAFFFLVLPFQTPDEQGHFETVYWVSQFTYPYVNEDYSINPYPYANDIAQLFNFGNENPMLIVDYERIRHSPLQTQQAPSLNQSARFLPIVSQAYNPPLYYLVGAFFLKMSQLFQVNMIVQFYAVRLASSFFYFGMMFVFYALLKRLFTQMKYVYGFCLFVGLNPLVLQSGIGISPDIATAFFALLFCFVVIKDVKYQQPLSLLTIIKLGVICGLTSLSKITGLTLIPSFLLFLYFQRKHIGLYIKEAALFISVFVLTQIPWLLLNIIRYNKIIPTSIALGLPVSEEHTVSFFNAALRSLLGFRHTIMHYAGFLGWNDVYPFPPIFWAYTISFLFFFIIGIYGAVRKRIIPSTFFLLLFLFNMLFFFSLALTRTLYYEAGWGIGGRNILHVFPLMSIYVVIGISQVFKKNKEEILPFLSFFSIGYYFYSLIFVLIPRYYV